jgi:hypothetical protein
VFFEAPHLGDINYLILALCALRHLQCSQESLHNVMITRIDCEAAICSKLIGDLNLLCCKAFARLSKLLEQRGAAYSHADATVSIQGS